MMDMGQHAIKEWPEPELLHQVLVPGLEDRARLAPELVTFEQLTSGRSHRRRPSVTRQLSMPDLVPCFS